MQKNILGSRWQESKTSQTLLQCCVLCVHLPLPALVFTATTGHVGCQQTSLPVPLTARGTSWVTAAGTGMAALSRSRSPTQPGSAGNTAGLLHSDGLLGQGCSAPQQHLPCQDDDPGTHISQRASLSQALYREKAPEGSGLHPSVLPGTILQFAQAQCAHVSIQHPRKDLPCCARTANLSSARARSITCISLFTECQTS